jgi:site-specific DNA recombinase
VLLGTDSGGTSYYRGALYQILKNRIYLAEIPHRGQNHPGEHAAIVPRELWDRVQAQLKSDHQGRRNGLKANSPSLLVGLLQDAEGNRFFCQWLSKYASKHFQTGQSRRSWTLALLFAS